MFADLYFMHRSCVAAEKARGRQLSGVGGRLAGSATMSRAVTKALLREVESKIKGTPVQQKKGQSAAAKAKKKRKPKQQEAQPGYLLEQAKKKEVAERLRKERNVSLTFTRNHGPLSLTCLIVDG